MGAGGIQVEFKSKLIALSGIAAEYTPDDIIDDKTSDFRIDLELLRSTGRQLLGDIDGSKLLMDKNIPRSLVDWLRSISKGNALVELMFGKIKFC